MATLVPDCEFDGGKIFCRKMQNIKNMNNCEIFKKSTCFQGKMDRYGKTVTAWKIEKNIYNQEQICYGIKVIQEKTAIFHFRRVTYFTKISTTTNNNFFSHLYLKAISVHYIDILRLYIVYYIYNCL